MVDNYMATDDYGSTAPPASPKRNDPSDASKMSSGYKCWLLTIFVVCLSLTCGSLINGNGVRAMWRRAGIPCTAGSCPHTSRNLVATSDTAAASDKSSPLTPSSTATDSQAAANGQSPATAKKDTNEEDSPQEGEAAQQPDASESKGVAASMLQVAESRNSSETPQPGGAEAAVENEIEVCPAAEHEMQKWLKMFQSSEMIFAFTGFMLDYAGPKVTFVSGQVMLLGAIGLMGVGQNWWAMLVSGATTQLILNSCMCIGNIFISSRNLVMATLSGSADIAQFLFPVAYAIGNVWAAFDYYKFLIFWALVTAASAVAGLIWLPMKPFAEANTDDAEPASPESKPLISPRSHSLASPESVIPEADLPLWKAPVTGQITSVPFILFTLIWMQLAVRLNAYLDSNEDILRQYGDDGTMGSYFAYILPMSFIPCVLVGVLTDYIGVVHAVSVVNVMAIIVNILSLIPSLQLQWATIIFFLFFKCALFSIMFSFVAEVFGFSNFGTLTALISFVGGVGNVLCGYFAIKWVSTFNSWFWPTVVFLAMGIAAQAAIFYLVMRPPVPPKHTKEVEKVLHRKRLTHVSGRVGSSRASVNPYMHDEQRSLSKLSSCGNSPQKCISDKLAV